VGPGLLLGPGGALSVPASVPPGPPTPYAPWTPAALALHPVEEGEGPGLRAAAVGSGPGGVWLEAVPRTGPPGPGWPFPLPAPWLQGRTGAQEGAVGHAGGPATLGSLGLHGGLGLRGPSSPLSPYLHAATCHASAPTHHPLEVVAVVRAKANHPRPPRHLHKPQAEACACPLPQGEAPAAGP